MKRALTIDFLEHGVHVLQVVMIQEPHRAVLVIFIKGHLGERGGENLSLLWIQLHEMILA